MSLLAKLAKNSTLKQAKVLSESKFFTETDAIVTDVPILNLAFSGSINGGFRPGLISIAGPSKHFKSGLSLFCVKAYLDKYPDAICLFYDSEFGTPPPYLETMGIDTARVLHSPITDVEELKFDIVKQLNTIEHGDKVIIFIDSVGNLASKKEAEDALEGKSVADMSRAKAIKSLFRIITPHLTTKNIPMVAIQHVYQEMGLFPKAVISGGCLLAGEEIIMGDGSFRKIEDVLKGESVQTLEGPKEVTATWNPDTLLEGTPECYEVEFEDGTKVVCSDMHKFLINMNGNLEWVCAKDLEPNMNTVLHQ